MVPAPPCAIVMEDTTPVWKAAIATKTDRDDYNYADEQQVAASLIERASAEIEQMRGGGDAANVNNGSSSNRFHRFPPACLELLKSLEGNHRCLDCGEQGPQWAACRYGALLCLQCSGHHRSLGVQVSSVRSISMDGEWSVAEVLSMLEGGNSQIASFFERHQLTARSLHNSTAATAASFTKENVVRLRYKTKAALFYRRQMEQHVAKVLAAGPYRGREISRRIRHHASNSTTDSNCSNNNDNNASSSVE